MLRLVGVCCVSAIALAAPGEDMPGCSAVGTGAVLSEVALVGLSCSPVENGASLHLGLCFPSSSKPGKGALWVWLALVACRESGEQWLLPRVVGGLIPSFLSSRVDGGRVQLTGEQNQPPGGTEARQCAAVTLLPTPSGSRSPLLCRWRWSLPAVCGCGDAPIRIQSCARSPAASPGHSSRGWVKALPFGGQEQL